jgi:hypothetical protein
MVLFELNIKRRFAMPARTIILMLILAVFTVFIFSCGEGSGEKTDYPDSETVTDEDDDTIKSEAKSTLGSPLGVQRWGLLATGQHQCFDNEKIIPCPMPGSPFFGQDGNHQVGTRSYTVNESDGTVLDDVTGITWQRSHMSGLKWAEAQNYCDNLSLAGHKWRIPTTHEIKSLVDYGTNHPAINETAFPGTPSSWFWASPVREPNPDAALLAWIVSFVDGYVEYTARSNTYNVRCVKVD